MSHRPMVMLDALRRHWPEYLMEAAGLGLFMIAASLFAALLDHPASPVAQAIGAPLPRRVLMGTAMGLTAVGLIYSPWGRRSGAHLNPAVTLTFLRLGRVAGWDAAFYVVAQFAGGAAGLLAAGSLARGVLGHPSINWVATMPGERGASVAFAAETAISLGLMAVVLATSSAPRLAPFTGLFAGALVATFIVLEAPLSGMSMNPARSTASALWAHAPTALWIYFLAPSLGMLAAAELHARRGRGVPCAKLHHDAARRCIFRCGYRVPA